jgi:hypothetical protein
MSNAAINLATPRSIPAVTLSGRRFGTPHSVRSRAADPTPIIDATSGPGAGTSGALANGMSRLRRSDRELAGTLSSLGRCGTQDVGAADIALIRTPRHRDNVRCTDDLPFRLARAGNVPDHSPAEHQGLGPGRHPY